MTANQTASRDTPARPAVLPGAVVALVALLGVQYATAPSVTADRVHKTVAVAVRAATPANAAILSRARMLNWTAGALVILLVIGRQVLSIVSPLATARLIPLTDAVPAVLLLRRKASISYHNGGRYGP